MDQAINGLWISLNASQSQVLLWRKLVPKESNCFKALISDPLIVPTPCTLHIYWCLICCKKKAEYCEIDGCSLSQEFIENLLWFRLICFWPKCFWTCIFLLGLEEIFPIESAKCRCYISSWLLEIFPKFEFLLGSSSGRLPGSRLRGNKLIQLLKILKSCLTKIKDRMGARYLKTAL